MIIIRKKKLLIFITLICIGVILINEINYNRTHLSKQVNTQSVDEKVVIIDAGHGRRRWRSSI